MKKIILYSLFLVLVLQGCVANQQSGQMETGWLFWVFLGLLLGGVFIGALTNLLKKKKDEDSPTKAQQEIEAYEETLKNKLKEDSKEDSEGEETETDLVETESEVPEETVSETPVVKEVKPAQQAKVATPAQTSAPTESTASKGVTGTYNFGYAMYTGQLKNGKPNGRGKLVFTASHTDNVRNYKAEIGYYIEGNFTNGLLDNGSLYTKEGSKVKTIY